MSKHESGTRPRELLPFLAWVLDSRDRTWRLTLLLALLELGLLSVLYTALPRISSPGIVSGTFLLAMAWLGIAAARKRTNIVKVQTSAFRQQTIFAGLQYSSTRQLALDVHFQLREDKSSTWSTLEAIDYVLHESELGHKVLVTGSPGSGKTTFLYEIAESAARDEHEVIAFVARAATWDGSDQTFSLWLWRLLRGSYGLSARTLDHWFSRSSGNLLLPLIDGFDEVAVRDKPELMSQIAQFQGPVVVAAREIPGIGRNTFGAELHALPLHRTEVDEAIWLWLTEAKEGWDDSSYAMFSRLISAHAPDSPAWLEMYLHALRPHVDLWSSTSPPNDHWLEELLHNVQVSAEFSDDGPVSTIESTIAQLSTDERSVMERLAVRTTRDAHQLASELRLTPSRVQIALNSLVQRGLATTVSMPDIPPRYARAVETEPWASAG